MSVRPELRRPDEGLPTQLFQLRPRYKPVVLEVGLALFFEFLSK